MVDVDPEIIRQGSNIGSQVAKAGVDAASKSGLAKLLPWYRGPHELAARDELKAYDVLAQHLQEQAGGKCAINVADILRKTHPLVQQYVDAGHELTTPNEDWFLHWHDKARLCSDEEMQRLWSAILAGEISRPGSYSKRAMSVLSDMSQTDIEAFNRVASFVVFDISENPIPMIVGLREPMYRTVSQNILLDSARLDDFGLTHTGGNMTFQRTFTTPSQVSNMKVQLIYFNKQLVAEVPGTTKTINIGVCNFTRLGDELLRLTQPVEVEGFLDYLNEKLGLDGTVTTVSK